ncbi:MAG: hypothetical protein IJP70_11255 [Bacteroidales bacterium]|nr:hypothetical protein [Bacteroidales bacterium]
MKHITKNHLFTHSQGILILWLSVLLFAGQHKALAASTIEPGSEKENNASGGTVANEQVDGESYYISGTYIAGKGSMQVGSMTSKGFKIRTGQKGGTLTINVNYPYTITELTMTGIANYSAVSDGACISVTKVEVDGEEVSFTGGEFLAKETKESATLSVSGINAADSIKLYFDNSNATGTQINMCYNIKWQRPIEKEDEIQGTISWDTGKISESILPAIQETSMTIGNDLIVSYYDASVNGGSILPTYQPVTDNPGNKTADMIEYTIKMKEGFTFTPTSIAFDAVKHATDNAYFSWCFVDNDDIAYAIKEYSNSKTQILRNNNANANVAPLTHEEEVTVDPGRTITLRFYISNVANTKKMSIGNIKINGIVTGNIENTSFEKKNPKLGNFLYTIPEEDILYDESHHAAHIYKSEGLGNIQIYYTNASDGTKTDVAPSAAGTYTVSFECEGNDLYNETLFENVGTFSISNVNLQDWQILTSAYQTFPKTDQWNSQWDFSGGTNNAKNLYGVTFRKGQVTAINLASNNLSGDFPLSLLLLPSLQSLNLSGNQITGDIGLAIAAFMQLNPTAKISVQEINVSNNLLSGNIGIFAHFCPLLTKLIASGNCIEDVYPMISTTVESIDLSHQTIARVVPIHLAQLDSIVNNAPSILLYNHTYQSFVSNVRFQCYTQDESWGMVMEYKDGHLGVSYVLNQNTYYGKSGDTLNVSVLNGMTIGSTIRFTLGYDTGDCNFDGKVNVLDLQTDVLYILENYQTRPYNFVAANLWEDEQINVQDVICLVNLLMETDQDEPASATRIRRSAPYSETSDAFVYVENGKLMVNTSQPVAAFDITIGNANAISIERSLQSVGMSVTTSKTANGIRLIGYSLNGASLPNGISEIGTLDKNTSYVRNAMLSDVEANAILTNFGSTTGIDAIESTSGDDLNFYDLQGRKIQTQPHKGLYIQNGHKLIK